MRIGVQAHLQLFGQFRAILGYKRPVYVHTNTSGDIFLLYKTLMSSENSLVKVLNPNLSYKAQCTLVSVSLSISFSCPHPTLQP